MRTGSTTPTRARGFLRISAAPSMLSRPTRCWPGSSASSSSEPSWRSSDSRSSGSTRRSAPSTARTSRPGRSRNMLPICKPDGRCIRVEVDSEERWGSRAGDQIVLSDGGQIDEATASYLAPASPSKIIAVHLTYGSRVREYDARTPPEPSYFMKPPTTLNGHRRPVQMARGARFLNYEGELAVVIGERMKGVPVGDVLDYVGGYTCANDIGMHDFRHADRGAMLRVKGHDGFLPLGPELVPAAEFDPTDYTLRTYLN